ncbi:pyridoxine 4-dehydrogenase [Scheffersomyces xylosifermentans]|uniref:pyridoxine 4-dehydrogenase n=1 Tax=Scheffersomyces xylosifermentans TaxID=1304137 RepID=UPI00315D53BA
MSDAYKPVDLHSKFGFGTMSMTWTPTPPPTEQSVESLKFVTSHDEFGTKVLNGGIFYGADNVNLKLLQAFVESNTPEQNRELVISIKGGLNLVTHKIDGSKESIDGDIETFTSFFPKDKNSRPKLIFEMARVDKSTPYDETIGYIADHVKNGAIDGISLSEVGIESIRKAVSVFPISCVELELSLFSQDIIENGILEELSKHGIPVIAYSPLYKGLLTDYAVEHADTYLQSIPKGDMRLNFDRFQPETFDHNMKYLKALYKYAHDVKKTSLESLSLSWILAVSERKEFKGIKNVSKILPIPSGSTKDKITRNFSNIIELSDDDLQAIDNIYKENPIKGFRYNAQAEDTLLV